MQSTLRATLSSVRHSYTILRVSGERLMLGDLVLKIHLSGDVTESKNKLEKLATPVWLRLHVTGQGELAGDLVGEG